MNINFRYRSHLRWKCYLSKTSCLLLFRRHRDALALALGFRAGDGVVVLAMLVFVTPECFIPSKSMSFDFNANFDLSLHSLIYIELLSRLHHQDR